MESNKFVHSYLVCCVCGVKWDGMSSSHLGCFTRIDCQKWMAVPARTPMVSLPKGFKQRGI